MSTTDTTSPCCSNKAFLYTTPLYPLLVPPPPQLFDEMYAPVYQRIPWHYHICRRTCTMLFRKVASFSSDTMIVQWYYVIVRCYTNLFMVMDIKSWPSNPVILCIQNQLSCDCLSFDAPALSDKQTQMVTQCFPRQISFRVVSAEKKQDVKRSGWCE